MSVVEIVDHPLIQHKISLLRDRNTGTKEFRDLVSEIAMLLCYEATRDLPTEEVEVETPVALARTKVLAGRKLALVPILRAGLGMVDGMLNLIPAAKVGHIGMYRNEETLEPVEYYCKLPNDINEREVFVLDPMLATGGSACDAIGQIKKRGAKHIKFIGLVAAPQGLKALHEAHPDVDIYVGALDEKLNDNGYIVPGLGQQFRRRCPGGDDLLRGAIRRNGHGVSAQNVELFTVVGVRPDGAVMLPQLRGVGLLQHGVQVGGCRQDAHAAAVGVVDGGKVQRRAGKRDGRRQCGAPARQCAPLGQHPRRPAADMLFRFYG